jgi:hypothetical protein
MTLAAGPFLIREGHSLQTQTEVIYDYLRHVAEIAEKFGSSDEIYLTRDMVREAEGMAGFPESAVLSDFQELEGEAETLLYSIGFFTEWRDGGYVIHEER